MTFVSVTEETLPLLEGLIANLGEAAKTFRYFQKREATVSLNHLATVLLVEDGKAVGYGHLEVDGTDVWLALCVLPQYSGKGWGRLVMTELIAQAKANSIRKISLTVDKVNAPAIHLYETFGFKPVNQTESYTKYELNVFAI